MKMMTIFFLIFFSLTHASKVFASSLSFEEAKKRAAQVSFVGYELFIHLDETSPEFSGKVGIDVELKNKDRALRIDFAGGSIGELSVNGKSVSKPDYDGLALYIPRSMLETGKNKIQISYKHPYSKTGVGLYRFKDPEDGRVYVYSDFEPFDANQMFPCLDQPDLKATYALRVSAPKEWQVISTSSEEKIEVEDTKSVWHFRRTPQLSTYIFSLHAGPYHVWKSSQGETALRLFARKSIAKYVDSKEWFDVTKKGLRFFGKYFDYSYPFQKYDQIIVPDFNSGAMENVAAVTFSERFIHRSTPTQDEREDLANVILHEMAHMWFGDLVTMRWWNGLWLNESFATYMASLALNEATSFKKAWHSFFSRMKQWAYWEDQLVTTHPIETAVSDTETAFTNFDGITYGKGASALKQLAYYIGEEKFRDGVRRYFRKHAYQNAELKDFIGALEEVSKINLSSWTNQWLNTSGLNTIQVEYECDGKADSAKIKRFAILQTASTENPTLRMHRTRIGLYSTGRSSQIRFLDATVAAYQGEKTELSEMKGKLCPDLVFANEQDYDYVKLDLDPLSVATLKKGIQTVNDPFTRGILWDALWEMTRDGKLKIGEYADLVMRVAHKETDLKVLTSILGTLTGRSRSFGSVLHYLPDQTNPRASELRAKIEDFFWKGLQSARSGSDIQKLWFDGYVRVAHRPEAVARLKKFLSGSQSLPGFKLDQDRRWDILVNLNAHSDPEAEKRTDEEKARDRSDKGLKMAISAEAIRPSVEVKEKWFAKISDPKSQYSLADLRQAMGALFPREQIEFRARFGKAFFMKLVELSKSRDSVYLRSYVSLVPALCTEQSAAEILQFTKSNSGLPATVIKNLRIAAQEDQRCQRVRLSFEK